MMQMMARMEREMEDRCAEVSGAKDVIEIEAPPGLSAPGLSKHEIFVPRKTSFVGMWSPIPDNLFSFQSYCNGNVRIQDGNASSTEGPGLNEKSPLVPGTTRNRNDDDEESAMQTEVPGLFSGKEAPIDPLRSGSELNDGNMDTGGEMESEEKMLVRTMRWIWAALCALVVYMVTVGEFEMEVELNAVDEPEDVQMGDAASGGNRKMRKLPRGILVDSGAGASVADGEKEFPEYAREDSEGSKRGQMFMGPGSEKIPNRGQKKVNVTTASGVRSRITFQDSPVRRPILAVSDSTKAGNLVAFDQDESVIIPRDSEEGVKIREIIARARRKVTLELEQGVYQIPAWVAPPDAMVNSSKNTRQGR